MQPITIRGNAFWQGNERFLVKGVSYCPRIEGRDAFHRSSLIDPLAEDRLENLRRDIAAFTELGLNTIHVYTFDNTKSHEKALSLLSQAGIYVLIDLCNELTQPKAEYQRVSDANFDVSGSYTVDVLYNALRTVDLVDEHSCILGFFVCGEVINSPARSKNAETLRAAVRDIKHYMTLKGGRRIPAGVSGKDLMMIRKPQLQYFTAGPKDERVDFYALQCWSWAGHSSYKISGWESLCKQCEDVPVPMFLSSYGTNIHRPRIFQETSCLYSPLMTGVFSGGCVYTFIEPGNDYGMIANREEDEVEKKQDFFSYKKRLTEVAKRPISEVFAETKEITGWLGEFPKHRNWFAGPDIPKGPADWETIIQCLRDAKEWDMIEIKDAIDIIEDSLD